MFDLTIQATQEKSCSWWRAPTGRLCRHTVLKLSASARPGEQRLSVSGFAESLVRRSPRFFSQLAASQLHNLRGRPEETFATGKQHSPDYQLLSQPRREELFFCSGVVFAPRIEINRADFAIPPEVASTFFCQLNTTFSHFEGARAIVHNTSYRASQLVAAILPQGDFLRPCSFIPGYLETMRLGFEVYQSRFFGSLIGRVPDVETRFYLEVQRQGVDLFFECFAPTPRGAIPLPHPELMTALQASLAEAEVCSDLLQAAQLQLGD